MYTKLLCCAVQFLPNFRNHPQTRHPEQGRREQSLSESKDLLFLLPTIHYPLSPVIPSERSEPRDPHFPGLNSSVFSVSSVVKFGLPHFHLGKSCNYSHHSSHSPEQLALVTRTLVV
jgi:hypothetical protein